MADAGLFDIIGSSLLGIGTGGIATIAQNIFGGISGWITEWQKRKTLELQHQQEMVMADKQIEVMRVEGEVKVQEAREERAMTETIIDGQNYQQSLLHDSATYSRGKEKTWADFLLVVADAIRGITRPVMTVFLCWITWSTYQHFTAYLAESNVLVNSDTANEMVRYIVMNTVFMSSSAVGWWFSSRPSNKAKAAA
ncbi:hypothetical protein [Maridesulfovibrio ferrireducens]|uniref:hypothetical protein n=1 Tax=Maridesulfovibrio ferrireducens TaxID=246191 RepID=UPI001A266C04|nr:hypothetical protein [Maridesulfovibrio ferrireducens]MBI9110328.1 hypothetical protein [Maridesulfovibrio ferrireducens]